MGVAKMSNLKKKLIFFVYGIVIPILIIGRLIIAPALFDIDGNLDVIQQVIKIWMTIYLIACHIPIGISFHPAFGSSSSRFAVFGIPGRYRGLRTDPFEPTIDHSIFPIYYFVAGVITCSLAGLIFFLALHQLGNTPLTLSIIVGIVDFIFLIFPLGALYPKVVKVVYPDD